jgi:predicted nucleic acid-binding protein
LIVLDSSGWLEYFGDGPYADEFAARLRNPANVLTPTVALYEVYKVAKRDRSEEEAIRAVAMMKKTQVVELTEELALTAADLSLAHGLSMADSMMLAVAHAFDAELATTDAGFTGIDGVTVFSKKRS